MSKERNVYLRYTCLAWQWEGQISMMRAQCFYSHQDHEKMQEIFQGVELACHIKRYLFS